MLDTAGDGADRVPRPAGSRHPVAARSMAVLRVLEKEEAAGPPEDSAAASVAFLTKDSAD